MTRSTALWPIPAAFFLLFFVYPVVVLLGTALAQDPIGALAQLTDSGIVRVVLFTVLQAAASTLLTLLIGLPGAAVLARYRFRGRSLIETLAVVAFVMPTVVVATAITTVLPDGLDRGLLAILAAHVYFNLAVVLRLVGTYWAQLDDRPEAAAACLGASPVRVFASVTLPRLRPALWSAAALVFLFTFTSFGIVLLLGGPGQATIEVEIQRQAAFLFNLPLAAALSLLQIVLVVLLLLVQHRLSTGLAARSQGSLGRLRPPRTPRERVAVAVFVIAAVTVLVGPVAMVVVRALRVGEQWSLANFTGLQQARSDSVLFVSPAEAVVNSLVAATAAAVIAVVVGGLVAWLLAGSGHTTTSGWDAIWLLPLGVSAVTLGFGILLAFDQAPVNWRAAPWLVPVVQALIAIPFVVRALLPALAAIGPRVRQAAATLGASPLQVLLRVELPIVWRSLAVALGFAFAISLGEFGATLFVARGDRPTVPIAIYRFLGTPGEANQGMAMALATILILLTAVVVLITERWRRPGGAHV